MRITIYYNYPKLKIYEYLTIILRGRAGYNRYDTFDIQQARVQ